MNYKLYTSVGGQMNETLKEILSCGIAQYLDQKCQCSPIRIKKVVCMDAQHVFIKAYSVRSKKCHDFCFTLRRIYEHQKEVRKYMINHFDYERSSTK